MGTNKSSGATPRPNTKSSPHTSLDQVAEFGLQKEMDVACLDPDCRHHPQKKPETPATETGYESCRQDLEASREVELALEKTRLELLRRKELALIEMQKIVDESRRNSRIPNVKS